MHVMITGHTGFKGSWLALMLHEQGHRVSGISLDPAAGSLFECAQVALKMSADIRLDIRDSLGLTRAIAELSPDVVIHLAAQPLVRRSYVEPRLTMETNVMGTYNVLEAVRKSTSVRACLMVTTDKVYRNEGLISGYREDAPLGGFDPYSASKAMADLLVQSWTSSYPGIPITVARAGNVIGGGDVSRDRLLPDLTAAFREGRPALVRNPAAVRPWQHVLDCLSGYLLLLDRMLGTGEGGVWNFGPEPENLRSVSDVADLAVRHWGGVASWDDDQGIHPHEAKVLALDSTRARTDLGWRDRLAFEEAVAWTVSWERRRYAGESAYSLCREQIESFRGR